MENNTVNPKLWLQEGCSYYVIKVQQVFYLFIKVFNIIDSAEHEVLN